MESSPLLPSNASGSKSSKWYFLGKSDDNYVGGITNSVRDGDGGEVVETLPEGATEDEFAPRELAPNAVSTDGTCVSNPL